MIFPIITINFNIIYIVFKLVCNNYLISYQIFKLNKPRACFLSLLNLFIINFFNLQLKRFCNAFKVPSILNLLHLLMLLHYFKLFFLEFIKFIGLLGFVQKYLNFSIQIFFKVWNLGLKVWVAISILRLKTRIHDDFFESLWYFLDFFILLKLKLL